METDPSSCMSKSQKRVTDNSLGSRSTPDISARACRNRNPADPPGNSLRVSQPFLGSFCASALVRSWNSSAVWRSM